MERTHVIKGPIVTEKLEAFRESQRLYAFWVDKAASKQEVADAVSKLFGVKVEEVRTCIVRGKTKRRGRSLVKRPNYKKAFVQLKEGEKITLFDGGVS
ncbi:MAG: 50S ribosomal protein L23 [Proteobacteria bacterium]|nr:50S ribosomal protein L23 [Cystobacterineae bacterium]MCL2258603.1 50S ribosomal protein L23 [Cystobacterineae bacterium]MCL2315037.1 50S ribosomal protein L23 [Pseudomonadota bacterium]